jgi:delta 1-pyrroline-5-carboxylate dehydrogenase
VAALAGANLKKVALEMGGSDPFILLSTDDLDAVVEAAAEARLDNSGQSCNAPKRFIVIDSLYDAFVEKFTANMDAQVVGDGFAEDTTVGPLSSLAAADRLEAFRPGYAAVKNQQNEPRGAVSVKSARLSADRREITFTTAARVSAVNYAVAIPDRLDTACLSGPCVRDHQRAARRSRGRVP